MRYYCLTLPGLERIAAQEIQVRLAGSLVAETAPGVVHFDYAADPRPLLSLGTVEDVFVLLAREQLDMARPGLVQAENMAATAAGFETALATLRALRPRKVRRVTFRVVVQRPSGHHAYVRPELGRRVAHGVKQKFPRWKQVDENSVLELWVLQRGADTTLGLRLSDRTMRHRTYKQASVPASLRPVAARAMVICSQPEDSDVFLDPMCGAGTILIERGEHGRYRQLLGGDIDPEAVAATRTNVGPRYKPIQIRHWDATALPMDAASVSRVVSNLPFGRKIAARGGTRVLYRAFLAEAARVLAPGGRLVLLTSEVAVLRDLLSRQDGVSCERVEPIFVLGRRASIFTATRSC